MKNYKHRDEITTQKSSKSKRTKTRFSKITCLSEYKINDEIVISRKTLKDCRCIHIVVCKYGKTIKISGS